MGSLRPYSLCFTAFAAVGILTADLRAATGDILVQYRSYLGTVPAYQYWTHEGRCLSDSCPGPFCPQGSLNCFCWFQGARDLNTDYAPDNNCLPGIGCVLPYEHYNAPEPVLLPPGCAYTEWIALDNGNNNGARPLTISDSTVPDSPPWGAPSFLNAPAYPVLRISTGDGNDVSDSLPTVTGNFRNIGKAKIRKTYDWGGATAVTLLCKVAAGPRSGEHEFIQIRGDGPCFCFGVDGDVNSPTYGRITYGEGMSSGDDASSSRGTLFNRTVLVAQPGMPGPHAGEFFTLRAILRNDGVFQAWLNEDLDSYVTGVIFRSFSFTPEVQLTPDVNDATMWFDFVKLMQGEVPLTCPDPVVDSNRDGIVNTVDLDAFFQCATGAGVSAPGGWSSLPGACRCMDADGDQDLDMVDFGVLQRCLNIGDDHLDPACDD